MSTSIELTEVPTRIRRHSFSEAIEAGKEFPESYAGPEEKEVGASSIDDKAQTTAATTTTTSVSYKSSAMGTVSDVLQSYGIFIGIVVLVVAAIAALLVVILVPLSFADLDYYQIGFRMRMSTGQVDTSRVFGPGGRYSLGVDYTFKAFPSDAHFVTLNDLSVFSRDRLELFLDVTFQYFIRPDELQPLHDAYDRQYNDIIISRAESVIKSVAPRFNTMDYFTIRSTIEREMARVLFEDLGGTGCCDSYCSGDLLPDYRIEGLDCVNCTMTCAPNRQRFNVDVRYYQLLQIRIPSDVSQQFLNTIILDENAEQEQFAQDASVETLAIERDVQDIMNQATELREAAAANATLIRAVAQANATAIVEDARTRGLALLIERLNITNPRHKASLDYLRTLRRTTTNVRLHVGFRDTISGPYNGQNVN